MLHPSTRIQMYEDILDSASDTIFVLSPDEEMRFIYLNESTLRSVRTLAGADLTRDDLIGRPVAILGYPPEFMDRVWAAMQRALSGQPSVEQYTLRRLDGTTYGFECVMNVIRLADGRQGVVGVTRDLGPRETAALTRGETLGAEQRARQDAEQAVHLRNDFLSTAAHDLKTPLTAAQGRAQLLRRHLLRANGDPAALDLERIETHIEGVQAAITQMAHQISELQDVAFLQIGRPLNLNVASTDLVTLTAECIGRVSRSEAIRPVIAFRHPDDPVIVPVDPVRMTRVIDNLLSNAVKYGRPPEAHIEITLSVRADGDDEEVVVQVADDGIGIPAADIPGVFARFVRASNVGDINGQGVGLAGARQIARQHGGDLTVESREGEGSVFTLVIPRNLVHPEQLPD
ncbi:MAG: PAS domain-containing sensor histidine kinase [Thermomicrobiales bacterium]